MKTAWLSCVAAAAALALVSAATAATTVTFNVQHQVANGVESFGLLPQLTTGLAAVDLASPNWDFYASSSGGGWSTSFSNAADLVQAASGNWTLTDSSSGVPLSYTLAVDASSFSGAFRNVTLTSGAIYGTTPTFTWSITSAGSLPQAGDAADVSFREVNDAVTVLGQVNYPSKTWSPAGGPFAQGLYEVSVNYLNPSLPVSYTVDSAFTDSLTLNAKSVDGLAATVSVMVPEPTSLVAVLAGMALLRRPRNRRAD